MIALDASVLIAILRRTDAHHERSREVLNLDDVFEVHPINLAEALVAPTRAGRHGEALAAWLSAGVVEWPGGRDQALGLARLRVETSLRLPDCCPVLVAEASSRRLATFDTRLAGAARDRGIEVLGADL